MAINLFCYSNYVKLDAQILLDKIEKKFEGLFLEKFLLSSVNEMDEQHYLLLQDFDIRSDFVARSFFLILLADKNAAPELDGVARIMKTEFGEKNLIILYENESVI
jgi:hypothetical protein